MQIAYANATYTKTRLTGGTVHVGQFINNAVALGHGIWVWQGNEHPSVKTLPTSFLALAHELRKMDVLYVRTEDRPVKMCRRSLPPFRTLYRLPVVVWEFNTSPLYGRLRGRTEEQIRNAVEVFRHFGKGCDLAVCVSNTLADYVQNELGIKRVLVVPNGSDPDLFHPDVTPVNCITKTDERLNVVWIGSGYIGWHNFKLLKEVAQIHWNHPGDKGITFHLIGSGMEKIMSDMPPNVNYYGEQDYETLPRWLASMDVGLGLMEPGPGDYNSPLKIFDYMSSGLTVVSTEQPQVREIFGKLGQLSFLVPSDDPMQLVGVLRSLADNRQILQRQGQAGRQLVINHYNWRRAVEDTMNELETILAQKRRSVVQRI